MPTRYWIILVVSLLAGVAVLRARPAGRKQPSSEAWRGRVKPVPPPPLPPGPRAEPPRDEPQREEAGR
jgi:hypothetical protein